MMDYRGNGVTVRSRGLRSHLRGTAATIALSLLLSGCGAAGSSAHTQEKGSAVDEALSARAAEEDGAEGLILTPDSYREREESDVDAEILSQARDIAEETGVEAEELSEGAQDWRDLDLQDGGEGFAMAQMPEGCDVDVDLTLLNSTMVYSEVYNMMYYPEKYRGKTVRMRGTYTYYQDEETKKVYLACFISDAAACCQQGIEFEPRDMATMKYPEDYPKEYEEITVVGTYDTYEEGGLTYCTLRDAVMEEA